MAVSVFMMIPTATQKYVKKKVNREKHVIAWAKSWNRVQQKIVTHSDTQTTNIQCQYKEFEITLLQ